MSRHRPVTNALSISVDNVKCHRYGYCQAAAPDVFQLDVDGRLHYKAKVGFYEADPARDAARQCPMQAIEIGERK